MKRNKKIIIGIMLLILTIIVLSEIYSKIFAATYSIEYLGKVTYGASTVGSFKINGKRAFCTDHQKTTTPNGTIVESEIYNDDNIVKCLYYGWGGDEQWNFTSEAQGIVYTSLALDHFKNGNTNNTAKEFINYVNSMPVPEIELNFSESELAAFLADGNMQRTQSVEVTGSSKYFMTICLQDGVTLVNETRGTEETGNVKVYGGEQFYLKAPLDISGSWKSNDITNHKYKYQTLLYKSGISSYQELVSEYIVVEDSSSKINLSVNWLSTGSLQILKKDESTGEAISNTTFELRNQGGDVITQITTDENGYAEATGLIEGTYILVEINTDENYILDDTPYEITIEVGEVRTIEITNKLKTGSIKVVKIDADDNEIKLEGVKFEVLDENYNVLETITTDKNGEAYTSEYAIRDYLQIIIREVETLENYVLDETPQIVILEAGEIKTLTFENKIEDVPFENEELPRTGEDGTLINIINKIVSLTIICGGIIIRKGVM